MTPAIVSAFIGVVVPNLLQSIFGVILLVSAVFTAAAAAPPAGYPETSKNQISIDFAGPVDVIDLKDLLSPYTALASAEKDGSHWYLLSVTNGSVRPVSRVLMAADPANAALHIFPRRGRPELLQVASSDSGVSVERLRAVGRHSYFVTVPPATSASLAVRVAYGDEKPSVLAWNEPALVAHKRQMAVFLAAVAGLIAAAAAIMAGVAVITAHPAPGWAAIILLFVLLARLQGAELLDAGWMTAVGGPYGLGAMLAGLGLIVSIRLADLVAPFDQSWPAAARWRRWGPIFLIGISLAAFLGVPAATMLTLGLVVSGAALLTTYLVHRGLQGSRAARVIAPSAAVFALVLAAQAAAALGAFPQNPMASAVIGGFTAAGAVLLALAVAAGEGIAILPIARGQYVGVADAPAPPMAAVRREAAAQAIGAARQGIFDLSLLSDRLSLSREGALVSGISGAKSFGHEEWIARIHPDDRQVYVDALAEYRRHPGLAFRMEFRVQDKSGGERWLELRASMLGSAKRGTRCLGLLADISTRKEGESASPRRMLQDPLTGLGSRVSLMEELEKVGPHWAQVAFAVLDIDRFKGIHASLGDAGGDQLLVSFAARLTEKFAAGTQTFRIGGDSFAVLVPGAADYAERLGSELMNVSRAPFSIGGRNVFASATAGVVTGRDAEDPLELIRSAELALALAKRQGGGCAKVFVRNMEALVRGDAVALETDLRRGLSENEFVVHYQPVVRLSDGSVAGFEALLRWNHPEKGLVAPAEFIAHSEETGLIVYLGRFALERAASDLADWQRYFPVEPELFISVNVSRRQLQDPHFVATIEKLLAAGNFEGNTFKLEVTESAIELGAAAREVLTRLRALGAGLAIDDFGTGLSTLSHLKDLPFDMIKMDRSFLARRDAGRNTDAAAVLSSMIALARDLDRSFVIEGVETEREAMWLKQIGCDLAQGFYFSSPLPANEALKFIASHLRTDRAPQQRSASHVAVSGPPGVSA